MTKRWRIGDGKVHIGLSGEGSAWSDMTPTLGGSYGFGVEIFHISVDNMKVRGLLEHRF